MDVCVFQYVHACNLIEDVLVLFSHVHIFYCVFLFMLFFFFLFFIFLRYRYYLFTVQSASYKIKCYVYCCYDLEEDK